MQARDPSAKAIVFSQFVVSTFCLCCCCCRLFGTVHALSLFFNVQPAIHTHTFSPSLCQNMLDLCLWRLTAEGIKCAKLSGHMSVTARDTALRAFKDDPDVKVGEWVGEEM